MRTRYPAEWGRFLAQNKKAGQQTNQSCWTRLGEENHVAVREGERIGLELTFHLAR